MNTVIHLLIEDKKLKECLKMKKILSLILTFIMVISLAACAPSNEDTPEEPTDQPIEDNKDEQDESKDDEDKVVEEEIEEVNENNKDNEKEEKVEEDKTEEEEDNDEDKDIVENEKNVDLYFANSEYIQTGNEDLERVKAETRIIKYDDETILEEAIVRELLNGPTDKDLDNGIPDTVKLIGVELKNNTAYVNFQKDGMQGASLQETLTLEQILTSLLKLESVDKVQFLLDGEIPDSLMGHISSSDAFDQIPQ